MPFRPDWEAVVTPVVDFAVGRSEVDQERMVLIGRSFGGYLAPRSAAFEHRLSSLIADSGQFDMFDMARLGCLRRYEKRSSKVTPRWIPSWRRWCKTTRGASL